jgi:cell division protein ZapA (FtsZ GTPase activity inhibitor)|nr:MAG TPA: DNA-binding protein [Caudoviricetes sp.]DAK19655.1 MAG TPA: DNA binding protein [Caudoviricetes sp.]
MYMALTEEQARGIRKLGITVIEWKRCIKKSVNVFTYIMNKVVEKATQAWNAIKNAIEELTDGLSLAVEEIKERFQVPVSRRYKFVKILGAMGYDKQRVWALTRHTWLARSNC